MLAEQNTDTRLRVEVRKGERVIVDPAVTNARIFMYFYFCINIGSLAGQISMVFAEKYVSWAQTGFWLRILLTVLGRVLPRVPAADHPLPHLPLRPLVAEEVGTYRVIYRGDAGGQVANISPSFSTSCLPRLAPFSRLALSCCGARRRGRACSRSPTGKPSNRPTFSPPSVRRG